MSKKNELLDNRDEIIRKIRELNEDLKFVNEELNQLKAIEGSKPQVVYNDYRSW